MTEKVVPIDKAAKEKETDRNLRLLDILGQAVTEADAQGFKPEEITQSMVVALARTTWEHWGGNPKPAVAFGRRLNNMYTQTYRQLSKMAQERAEAAEQAAGKDRGPQ